MTAIPRKETRTIIEKEEMEEKKEQKEEEDPAGPTIPKKNQTTLLKLTTPPTMLRLLVSETEPSKPMLESIAIK